MDASDTYIGIDLGGTTIHIGMVDKQGNTLAKATIATEVGKGVTHAIPRIVNTINSFGKSHLRALGIGVPGILNIAEGTIRESTNLKSWEGAPLCQMLADALKMPVYIENDANMAAIGEQWMGAGRGTDNMFMVTLGSGVGGALILNGLLHRLNGVSGEFGHVVIDLNGAMCNCGRRGCLETFCGKAGIQRIVKEGIGQHTQSKLHAFALGDITPQMVALAASEGDLFARQVFNMVSDALAIALANLVNLTGIDAIVIGGGIANAWEVFEKNMTAVFNQYVFSVPGLQPSIVKAKLGDDAGFIGAARFSMVMSLKT